MPIFTDEFSYTGMKVDGEKALILCILQTPMDYSDEDYPMQYAARMGAVIRITSGYIVTEPDLVHG